MIVGVWSATSRIACGQRQTAGEGTHICLFLKVTDIVGGTLVVRAKFNGVELTCLIDRGSQVPTIARPVYEAHFPAALCEGSAHLGELKQPITPP